MASPDVKRLLLLLFTLCDSHIIFAHIIVAVDHINRSTY